MLNALLAAALALPAAAAPTLERAASDLPSAVRELKARAVGDPLIVQASQVTNIIPETRCTTFVFEENGPRQSEERRLETRTWIEECDFIPTPPAGGVCIPRRRLLRWDEAVVSVLLADRENPSPREVFEVCMTGHWLDLRVRKSPFKYNVSAKDGRYTLRKRVTRQ